MVSGRPEPARGGQRVNSGGGSRGGGQQPAPRVTRRARVTAPPETPPRLNPNMPAAYKYFTYTPHTLLRTPRRRTILTDALSPAAAAAATPHVLSPARSQTPPQLTLPAPHSPVYAPCTVTSVLAITSYTPLKLGYKPACEIMTSTLCHKMPSIHSSHSVTKCLPYTPRTLSQNAFHTLLALCHKMPSIDSPHSVTKCLSYTLSTLSQNSLHTLLSQNTLHTLFALSDKSLPHVLRNYYPSLPPPLLCPKQNKKRVLTNTSLSHYATSQIPPTSTLHT